MREQQKDSIQNQFTAYLVTAITNSRINYFDKKLKQNKREVISQELLEQGFTSFDHQYHAYVSEREWLITKNWERYFTKLPIRWRCLTATYFAN